MSEKQPWEIEISAMRRCMNILNELPFEGRLRAIAFVGSAASQFKPSDHGLDPRQIVLPLSAGEDKPTDTDPFTEAAP